MLIFGHFCFSKVGGHKHPLKCRLSLCGLVILELVCSFSPIFGTLFSKVAPFLSKTMKDGDVTELVRNLGDLLSPFTVLHSALGTLHLDHLLAVNTFAWL